MQDQCQVHSEGGSREQLPAALCRVAQVWGELGHLVRNLRRQKIKNIKKREPQCLSAPKHKRFCFNLSTFSLQATFVLLALP